MFTFLIVTVLFNVRETRSDGSELQSIDVFVYADVSELRCVLSDRVHNGTDTRKLYAELFMRKGQYLER
jgi:hypothetical protein